MSLFTDAVFVSESDLTTVESEITDVSNTENIDVDNHIAFCSSEFADWLSMKLQAVTGYLPLYNNLNNAAILTAALLNQPSNRQRAILSQIIVSDAEYPGQWSGIKRILVYQCIEKFYRQASSRRGQDRYQEKRDEYRSELRNRYMPAFQRRGIGIIGQPMPCPGAILEPGSGTFNAGGNLSTLNSTAVVTDDPQFDVVVTWVDQRYYNSPTSKGNSESGPSAVGTIQVHPGDQIVVNIANLVGPNGAFRPAFIANLVVAPGIASGWNVYVAASGGMPILQNPAPIPYANKTFTVDASPVTAAPAVETGQYANFHLSLQDLVMRA